MVRDFLAESELLRALLLSNGGALAVSPMGHSRLVLSGTVPLDPAQTAVLRAVLHEYGRPPGISPTNLGAP